MAQAASLEEEPCKEEEELSCSAGEALAGTPVGGAEGQRSSENQQKCFFFVFQSSHNHFLVHPGSFQRIGVEISLQQGEDFFTY